MEKLVDIVIKLKSIKQGGNDTELLQYLDGLKAKYFSGVSIESLSNTDLRFRTRLTFAMWDNTPWPEKEILRDTMNMVNGENNRRGRELAASLSKDEIMKHTLKWFASDRIKHVIHTNTKEKAVAYFKKWCSSNNCTITVNYYSIGIASTYDKGIRISLFLPGEERAKEVYNILWKEVYNYLMLFYPKKASKRVTKTKTSSSSLQSFLTSLVAIQEDSSGQLQVAFPF